eukprot:CAMPEP_0194313056 /NCGR_PEP_ID=MMETSP0171-20130528/9952_1 /TAXON_ID=218684 /ORGANISM="Corethron pennatum, Strain L29A3" /LENGTH=425 /DNA_ID=CAMNT_0039067835 /DNA_START=121 /DNA_END=1395 /DNA_ORIENTATION=+
MTLVRELAGICAIGAAVEFNWAGGEAVLVPFLSRHGVPNWLVSAVYLANPMLGLYVQPRIGKWSDRLNRRVPVLLGLVATALVGITLLLLAVPVANALGLGRTAVVAAVFVGFGVADICFDCLLIPGRALLDDATPAGKSNQANSLFTGFQLGGRLSALLLAWSVGGLGGTSDSDDTLFNVMFSLCMVFLLVSTVAAVVSTDEDGIFVAATDDELELGPVHRPRDDKQEVLLPATNPNPLRRGGGNCCGLLNLTTGERALCTIQAVGWLGICAQSFFWTTWRGEVRGCADLAAQSAIGIATAGVLPALNARFGTAAVWCTSELGYSVLLLATALAGDDGNLARVIGALTGINYAVHANNALLVAANIAVDPHRRARTIAMVNNTLPVGQLVIALLGGTVAEVLGGFQWVFVTVGVLGLLITSTTW